MSQSTQPVTVSFGGLFLAAFIAIKVVGTSLAAWSWWWLLLPIVPLLGILVQRWGL